MKIILLPALFTALLAVTGCSSLPERFSMRPIPLSVDEAIPADTAVILVGVTGPATVNYLQFGHSSMPAINVRFPAKWNTIIAVAIPVGIKQLSLSTITLGGRQSGYFSSGMSYGYVPVRTPKLDIDKPGLYYIATLDTNTPGQFQVIPIPEQISTFRNNFRVATEKLEPINFKWPN